MKTRNKFNISAHPCIIRYLLIRLSNVIRFLFLVEFVLVMKIFGDVWKELSGGYVGDILTFINNKELQRHSRRPKKTNSLDFETFTG